MSLGRQEWEDLLIQDRPMVHIPFMVYPKCYPDGPEHEYADESKLELIADLIDLAKPPILVHCAQGIERSPLAVAYTLNFIGVCDSMEEAYECIIQKRTYGTKASSMA